MALIPIKLTNTLSGKKEEFKSIRPHKVGMYNCGPTVYDYAHIGNLRAYVFAETLRRTLELFGYNVKQVVNITDIGHLVSDGDQGEDKMTKALHRENKPLTLEAMKEVADFYTEKFYEDLRLLNIETSGTIFPKASEHVTEMIKMIEKLEEKGFVYKTSDGLYFDTSKFPDYGKLGNVNIKGLQEGARVEVNSEKKNFTDFALWKFNPNIGWNTKWGKGFPGWHIECSAMSEKYLGETFDIHTGGIDHIPVHHNNEIAQSESANGKPLTNFWLHNAFMNIDGSKMAKSDGNFLTLKVLIEKGFNPLAYRYWLLSGHYRTQMNFTFEALTGAQNALINLAKHFNSLKSGFSWFGLRNKVDSKYEEIFKNHLANDLDTPSAIATIWEVVKDTKLSDADKKATIDKFTNILGLDFKSFGKLRTREIPAEVKKLIKERDEARKAKDWKKSDELRTKIQTLGFQIEDSAGGTKIL